MTSLKNWLVTGGEILCIFWPKNALFSGRHTEMQKMQNLHFLLNFCIVQQSKTGLVGSVIMRAGASEVVRQCLSQMARWVILHG